MKKIISVLFVLSIALSSYGQQVTRQKTLQVTKTDTTNTEITLDDIFVNKKYVPASYKTPEWIGKGHNYLEIRTSSKYPGHPGVKELWLIDPIKGKEQLLVPADKLIPKGESLPLVFKTAKLTDDMKAVVLNGAAVGKDAQRSESWFLDLSSWHLAKITFGGKANGVRNISVSPDLKKIAFCRDNNIYVEDMGTGLCKQLTTDGSKTVINANSSTDFAPVLNVQGFKWSEDSKFIAYTQFNVEGVKDLIIINNTDSLYPSTTKQQYVKPGEVLPACKVGVVEIENSHTNWFEIPGDTRNNYITYFDWKPSSNKLFIQQLNRKQNIVKLYAGEISGKTELIYQDADSAFLTPGEMYWIDEGKSFLWTSEKSGWRHIYKVSADGKNEIDLIKQPFDVDEITGLDLKDKIVYFLASPTNAIYRYLYSVNTDGKGNPKKLSPDHSVGVNNYQISNDGKYAFHNFSNINTPSVISLVSLPDHRKLKILEDNSKLKTALANVHCSQAKFLKIDIGNGVILDAWQILPPNFDQTKKYPLIFHEYSMPGNQTVQDKWLNANNYMWYQMMAQKGFIVMNIDARGTPSLYGREWRKVIYGKHGILPSDDLAKATKKLIADFSYIDKDNIGIFGWSGGGMISLLQILRYPDIYKVAIPGAYLSSSRLYNAGFTERFLGLPQDNPKAYDTTAALSYVDGLKGDLLLMHGTGDDNVNYQSTEVLINKLIAAGKKFYVIPYPNRNHGMTEGVNTKYHQYSMYTWFFTDHLKHKN